ncbi:ThiF family adenylyltransferase [Asticcacaulis sp.]|uniref:ThiF family adenylyltransferase n=1 Tax=Asticcacaulis sp. TaxID=1872648 RepID=UPI0031D61D5D
MSAALISRNPHLAKLDEEGFELEIRGGYLLVHSVPYVKADRSLARASLVMALTLGPDSVTIGAPSDHTAYFTGDTPCHRDGSPLTAIINNSQVQDLGNGILSKHYFSSKPEGTGRYDNFYDKVVAYEGHLSKPARSHDPGATARTGRKIAMQADNSPFVFPDTATARYGIGKVSQKLAVSQIAIIGLGGTGTYILDLLSKTRVKEIHCFDQDQLLSHNLFRAPGAPQVSIEDFPTKVTYYTEVYLKFHKGIVPHPVHVTADNIDELAGFDFVFVSVDKGAARREIAAGLHRLGIPFIDCGIGVGLEDDTLDGCARVSLITPEMTWKDIELMLPFGEGDDEDDVYRKGVQIADLNAINAAMAVFRWKRYLTYYRDERHEINSVYMVEGNMLSNRRTYGQD